MDISTFILKMLTKHDGSTDVRQSYIAYLDKVHTTLTAQETLEEPNTQRVLQALKEHDEGTRTTSTDNIKKILESANTS